MRLHAAVSAAVLLAIGLATVGADRPSIDDPTIVHVLNRVGFGARPGDLARVRESGVLRYIEQQLDPGRIADTAADDRVASLTTLTMSPETIAERYERPFVEARRQGRQQAAGAEPVAPPADRARAALQRQANVPLLELSQHKLLRAVHSEKQLQEVLTDFWFNHFNVDARKGRVRFLLTEYERDAIRPHVLGRFRDLLGAAAKSPAMLFYLDNWMSATAAPGRGGRARPAAASRRGLNENYARELLELHTLGVDGGYTQKDVTEVARVFTGWTIRGPVGPVSRPGASGFMFDPRRHDTGDKVVLGHRVDQGGARDGEQVLDLLARHPSTARFIATKLARRFVADDPPVSVVDRAAARFRETDGDLREVTRAILTSPEFLSPAVFGAKVKTPFEFVVSAVRATGLDLADARPLVRALQDLGMPLYQCQPPTGYKDSADAWTSAGALVGRMNVALMLAGRGPAASDAGPVSIEGLDLSDVTTATIARASTPAEALALTLGSPEFQKR
jgi:uncharacterized protein (DUF1800 family)